MGNGAAKDSPSSSKAPTPTGSRNPKQFKEVEVTAPGVGSKPSSKPSSRASNHSRDLNRSVKFDEAPSGQSQQRKMNGTTGSTGRRAVSARNFREMEKEVKKKSAEPDIVFETFHARSGLNFQCMCVDGERYYLDSWETQEWQPFPIEWYHTGYLTVDSRISVEAEEDKTILPDNTRAKTARVTNAVRPRTAVPSNLPDEALEAPPEKVDDRGGTIKHPTKGKLSTYMFEEQRNVHCYFDKGSGTWVKLPISWELRSDTVEKMVQEVEDACSDWADRHDILAVLRACNYRPEDAIYSYYAWGDKGATVNPGKNSKDVSGKLIKDQENRIEELERNVENLKKERDDYRKKLEHERDQKERAQIAVQKLQDDVSNAIVDLKSAQLQLMSLERPKSVAEAVKNEVNGPSVDKEKMKKLKKQAKDMHKTVSLLKVGTETILKEFWSILQKMAASIEGLSQCDTGNQTELENLRLLYRKETLERKKLYNKLQELRGNIRVFCRVRRDDSAQQALDFRNEEDVLVTHPSSRKLQTYSFDKVFTPKSTQEEVFEDTLPVIKSCVDGYNVCILAYGQTGSGKTFTMMGPNNNPGVNKRAIKELLRICDERENVQYKLKTAMVEIYNETLVDLLSNNTNTKLEIKIHGGKLIIPGLTEVEVKTMADLDKAMATGESNRSVAATKMNSTSSRSHLLLILTVEGYDRQSDETSTGSLTMVDLAGSERVGKSEVTGQRLVEAAAINKSLTALGQVFSALREHQLHVPYRNSKLTHILQPSLGGDAKAALFVNASPDQNNVSETISTLLFGSQARQVELGQAKKSVTKGRAG